MPDDYQFSDTDYTPQLHARSLGQFVQHAWALYPVIGSALKYDDEPELFMAAHNALTSLMALLPSCNLRDSIEEMAYTRMCPPLHILAGLSEVAERKV